MYVQVIESLELGKGQSFLNVGSGSGYLSCLVSCLIGEAGVSHGIEINPDLFQLSIASCKKWFENILSRRQQGESDLPKITSEGVSFVQGNCFDIDVKTAKSVCLYDRIYIGAGCPENNLLFFISLLADDGILVAPIQERGELVSIRKIIGGCFETKRLSHVYFAPLLQVPDRRIRSNTNVGADESGSEDETSIEASEFDANDVIDNQESVAGADLTDENGVVLTSARLLVRLPTLTWRPTYSRHRQFPESFRSAVFSIFLALRFPNKGIVRHPFYQIHFHLWALIFSYASRSWFAQAPSRVDSLMTEISMERKMRLSAEKALREVRLEREMLRVLVVRLQRSLNSRSHRLAHESANEAHEDLSHTEDDDSVTSNSSTESALIDDGLMSLEADDAAQIGDVVEGDDELVAEDEIVTEGEEVEEEE